jgi:anti-sigma regulatory factor (Ser/Thr protein kinase)
MQPFIPFPTKCGDDLKVYQYSVECYRDALLSFGPVTIECGNVHMFTPLGLNLLASLIHNLHLQGREIIFIPPTEAKTLQYMTDQGFFDEFQFASSKSQLKQAKRSTSVMLRRMHDFVGSYPMQVADWLSRNSAVPQGAVEDMVAITLPELMNNVFDHSNSPIGCCVCAQAYQKEGKLTLSVTDLGIGFLESLLPRYDHLETESEAIALAVQKGVSSKSTRRNTGAGLYILCDWVKTQQGELEIISKDGKWKQLPKGERQQETLSFPFPGTCINMHVPTAVLRASNSTREYERYD